MASVWAKLANALFSSRCTGQPEGWGRELKQVGQRAGVGREAEGSEAWGGEERPGGYCTGARGRQFVCTPVSLTLNFPSSP